jgi:uncharacterized protein (TIGR00255 family)
MTGFGSATAESDGLRARVDIRAVNQRNLRLSVRSRPMLGPLEKRLRDAVGARIQRGSVDVYVELQRTAPSAEQLVQHGVARATVDAIRNLAEELGVDGELQPGDLLRVPDLFGASQDEPVDETEWELVASATERALEELDTMRREEGAALCSALRDQVAQVERFRTLAAEQAGTARERLRERLHKRVAELLEADSTGTSQQALEREVIFYAERADITEELDRLASHTEQFSAALDGARQLGKRLEFLAQEMLREINTVGSKCADTGIASEVVQAKLAIEQIKEQVANVE